ncbi:MAG: metallophosphoesterase [Cyanobacteria bacterium P01_C01_bin.72]
MGHRRIRRRIRKWIEKSALIAVALSLCCYIYGAKIEPNWVEIVPLELTIPHLNAAFDGFKIVQISDLHLGDYMPEKRFGKMVKLVNQQQPDAIAITGDFITKRNHFDTVRVKQQLSQLHSLSVTVAVLGNHDHWTKKIDLLKQILLSAKIDNLDNEVHFITRNDHRLALAGLDDPYWGQPDLDKILAQLPAEMPTILLVHEPDYIEQSAKTHRFALQLSGHSHGGQIRIPFVAPLVLPRGGKKYFAGLNQVEDTFTYTNRGLGMTNLPLRIASRPEITVFTLHSPT